MTKKLDLTRLDLMDALDLAILVEQEAMERYEELVAQMREVAGQAREIILAADPAGSSAP